MKATRVDEYHKGGCHFYGKLAVIDYLEDAKADKRWGEFCAGVSIDYMVKAKEFAKERYGDVEILLTVPELVVRLND